MAKESEYSFQLSAPLMVHGEEGPKEVTSISLRRPNAGDVFDLGNPFQFVDLPGPEDPATGKRPTTGGGIEMRLNGKVLSTWIVRLSGLDAGVVRSLEPGDLQAMMTWLAGLLAPVGREPQATKN
jgi:hypothetical protein